MSGKKTANSLINGKRIVMCGTNKRLDAKGAEKAGIFFALFNTAFNLTEYIFEDLLTDSETFRDVQINENAGFISIISETNNGATIKIRGFMLESNVFGLS